MALTKSMVCLSLPLRLARVRFAGGMGILIFATVLRRTAVGLFALSEGRGGGQCQQRARKKHDVYFFHSTAYHGLIGLRFAPVGTAMTKKEHRATAGEGKYENS